MQSTFVCSTFAMMQHVARVRQRQLILVIFYCFMKILSPLIWYACDSVTLTCNAVRPFLMVIKLLNKQATVAGGK